MPKTKKKVSSDSDSDSGPDDRAPPPAKKSKDDKSSSSSSDAKQWTLEKLRQVRINEFRGRLSVDIREFYEKNGDILPGKKGISLTPTQWRKLLEYKDEINAALESS